MAWRNKCLLQWSQMETQGLVPNEWTYNAKVKVHSSVGNFDAALDTVQQMQARGVMPGKGTWDVIVSMAELMERHDIVQQVAFCICTAGPPAFTCTAASCVCAQHAHAVQYVSCYKLQTALAHD